MFPTANPESVGVRSEGIISFLDEMKEKHLHLHSLMILRHGKLIAETSFAPWSKDNLHMLFSLSKSFTSTAVGFAVQDGLLKLTDHLIDFFPELLPAEPCKNMKKVTVKHLLTMNSGHNAEPRRIGDNWEMSFLRSYVENEPGTHFAYSSTATYMLAAILQKVTGKKLIEYLREKFMDPLGMSEDIWFEESPTGVASGGSGLNVRVEDIAKLGQFYLQRGKWEGKQLLNEQWIIDAQTPWSDNSKHTGTIDWRSGYGYQFWMCSPEHIFRGDGANGQFCVIMPDQDMVIAITSGLDDMGAVLTSIWKNILPAVGEPSDASDDALRARLAETVTPACWEEEGITVSEPKVKESWLGSYLIQDNNMLGLSELEVTADSVRLIRGEAEEVWQLSFDEWKSVKNADISARAARTEEGLILHGCRILTPFEDILKLNFTAHGIEILCYRNANINGRPSQRIIGYRK